MLIYAAAAVDEIRAEDFNQFGRALRLVLGIGDTAQDDLGRLVLPRSSAAPGAPSEASVYYDTDDRRPSYRTAAPAWVPWDVTRGVQRFDLDRDVSVGRTYGRILEEKVILTSGRGFYVWTVAKFVTPAGFTLEEGFDVFATIDDSGIFAAPSGGATWVPRLETNTQYEMQDTIRSSFSGLTPGEHSFKLLGTTTALQRGQILGYDDVKAIPRTSLLVVELGG